MDPKVEERLEEVLMHYGVKGQKWGIRRTPAQLGHKPSGSKRRKSKSSKSGSSRKRKLSGLVKKRTRTKKVKRRKRASEFSDEELSAAVKRLELEKRYNDLVKTVDGQNTVKKGNSFVNTTLNKVVVPAFQEAGKEAIKNALKEQQQRRRRQNDS